MESRKIRFDYPLKRIQVPVVSTLVKQFNVLPNILSADIDASRGGWLVIELIGESNQIDQAVQWTVSQGVAVIDQAGANS